MSFDWPWLSLCVFWPLLGASGLILLKKTSLIKTWALLISGTEFFWCLAVIYGFDSNLPGWQFNEQYPWIRSLNIQFELAVDGVSVWLLLANSWLSLMVMIYNWSTKYDNLRLYYALLLIFEALSMGILLADDLMMFFFCWELSLVPALFLIAQWGIRAQRRLAATQYTLMMLLSGILLLAGIVLLELRYVEDHGGFNFSFEVLRTLHLTVPEQYGVMVLWLLAFAVKGPLPPFHNWLPLVALNAPPSLTALLLGMKFGLFGMMRLLIPLVPEALMQFQKTLAVWAMVSVLYAGLIAVRQTNLRALLAYSSISHVALVFMALMAFNMQAWQGACLQLINFSLISATLMLMAGMLEYRFASNDLCHLGGLARPLPRFTLIFFGLIFASVGLPGTSGFIAELMMLLGIAKSFPVMVGVVLLGAIVSASYSLNYLKKAFWGPLRHQALLLTRDLQSHEAILLFAVLLVIVILGLIPSAVISFQTAGLESLLASIMISWDKI